MQIAAERGVMDDVTGQRGIGIVCGVKGLSDLPVDEKLSGTGKLVIGRAADEIVREVVTVGIRRRAKDGAALQSLQRRHHFAGWHSGRAAEDLDIEMTSEGGRPGDELACARIETG